MGHEAQPLGAVDAFLARTSTRMFLKVMPPSKVPDWPLSNTPKQ